MSIVDIAALRAIAESEFADIVDNVDSDLNRVRIFLRDNSFLDVWYSLETEGRYSYHWERRHVDGTLYRHNNAPHSRWSHITTFPKHFHEGTEDSVTESSLSDDPLEALREMLSYARQTIK